MTTTNLSKQLTKTNLSFKAQTLAALCAVALAVALPQVFHSIGALTGHGNALGETFLPMHLPVLAAGFLAGPFAGALSGLFAPMVSFAISGMPSAVMLPIMCAELCAYGLISGLLVKRDIPVFSKLIIAQVGGRAVRALFTVSAVYLFGSTVALSTIWVSVITGICGILLQWAILPALITKTASTKKNDR